jgi:hypothetical protein
MSRLSHGMRMEASTWRIESTWDPRPAIEAYLSATNRAITATSLEHTPENLDALHRTPNAGNESEKEAIEMWKKGAFLSHMSLQHLPPPTSMEHLSPS